MFFRMLYETLVCGTCCHKSSLPQTLLNCKIFFYIFLVSFNEHSLLFKKKTEFTSPSHLCVEDSMTSVESMPFTIS